MSNLNDNISKGTIYFLMTIKGYLTNINVKCATLIVLNLVPQYNSVLGFSRRWNSMNLS